MKSEQDPFGLQDPAAFSAKPAGTMVMGGCGCGGGAESCGCGDSRSSTEMWSVPPGEWQESLQKVPIDALPGSLDQAWTPFVIPHDPPGWWGDDMDVIVPDDWLRFSGEPLDLVQDDCCCDPLSLTVLGEDGKRLAGRHLPRYFGGVYHPDDILPLWGNILSVRAVLELKGSGGAAKCKFEWFELSVNLWGLKTTRHQQLVRVGEDPADDRGGWFDAEPWVWYDLVDGPSPTYDEMRAHNKNGARCPGTKVINALDHPGGGVFVRQDFEIRVSGSGGKCTNQLILRCRQSIIGPNKSMECGGVFTPDSPVEGPPKWPGPPPPPGGLSCPDALKEVCSGGLRLDSLEELDGYDLWTLEIGVDPWLETLGDW